MKIIYLIAGTFNSGGMERVLANKVNWLAAYGCEVSIVTTDQRGRDPFFYIDSVIKHYDLGINYDKNNGQLLRKLISFPLKQWLHRRRLERLLKKIRADIVICMFNNDVNFVYKLKDGSHKFLEVHFSKNKKLQYGRHGLWSLFDRWRTYKEEKVVQRYERFVVLTKEDKAHWEASLRSSSARLQLKGRKNTPPSTQFPLSRLPVAFYPSRILVIPNARTFTPSQHATLQQKKVVAVGRYDYQKGFDTLLYIWERVKSEELRAKSVGWTLDIVGDGPQRPELQRQVEELGLQNSVRLLKPTDNIEEVLCSASVLAMTSRYEGLPMVLLEAQACGLPIVAFACQCGPRDIITDGLDGYLIENRDEAQFADHLITLMNDEPLRQRMGAAAIKASEHFGEERIMQQWASLFSKL